MQCVPQKFVITTNVAQAQNTAVSVAGKSHAANGLAPVRLTIGAMPVWVFFENLGKSTYTTAGWWVQNNVRSQVACIGNRSPEPGRLLAEIDNHTGNYAACEAVGSTYLISSTSLPCSL